MNLEQEVDVARRIAEAAGRLALEYQSRGVTPESKPDRSPVTIADRESELLIASGLEQSFPEDGLLGEEGALKKSTSGRRWIIDPIDGTRDFVRGIPTWSVLIGLEDNGEVVGGVCHLPALEETYFAYRGGGAFRNDARIRASGICEVSQGVLLLNSLNELHMQEYGPRLLEWLRSFWSVRSFGGCYDAMLVASGRAEVWIEPSAKPWDLAPLKIIAEEAGAVYFNMNGKGRGTIYGGNGVITAPGIAGAARLVLGGAAAPAS